MRCLVLRSSCIKRGGAGFASRPRDREQVARDDQVRCVVVKSTGKHTVKLELVDKDGNPVDNGGYNATTRDINVTR